MKPHTFVREDGKRIEVLNSETGTFKLLSFAGEIEQYGVAERVVILPTLDEQQRASAATVPRLRVVKS